MTLWERVSKQLSHPSGLGGRLIVRLMNRGNAGMNQEAIGCLGVKPGHRVLDVGFGGGLTIGPLLGMGATVAGIDRAADVVAAIRRERRGDIDAGRLEVAQADVHDLPFPDDAFDGVMTVNTIYFWPDLGAGLVEARRVLRAGGRLVVAIRDPAGMKRVSPEVFTLREPSEVREAIAAAGFEAARVESAANSSHHLLTATAP